MEIYNVGIDFGACNLKAVRKLDNGKLRCLKLNKSENKGMHTPNVLCYYELTKGGGTDKVIGQVALNRGRTSPENMVADIKRNLELAEWKKVIPVLGGEVTATEAARDIFECVKRSILENKSVKRKDDVEIHAALTVPVGSTRVQMSRLKKAAEDAGIVIDHIVSEPFAALFSMKETMEGTEDSVVVIFDFGGSTLDVSIARVEHPDGGLRVTELGAVGLHLGGLDIDVAIYEKIVSRKYAEEMEAILSNTRREELLEKIASMKEEMFGGDDDETVEDYLNEHKLELKREEVLALFEEEGYRKKITALLDSLFEDIDEVKEDVSLVIPFGGTSKIPYFIETLGGYFGKDVFDPDDFDSEDTDELLDGLEERCMAVAGGAVNYMGCLKDTWRNVKIVNSIPFSIGYDRSGRFVPLISKNERYGYETKNMPLDPGQRELKIYQCFSNQDDARIGGDDGAVYMGAVRLEQSKYAPGDAVTFRVRITEDGSLYLKTFQWHLTDDDTHEEVLVEELHVEMEG